MENAFLLTADCACGCASLLCFILKNGKKKDILIKTLWLTAAVSLLVCFGLMISYLLGDRFDYNYVYNHSEIGQAALYKVSALWSGQEGSFLLWSFILAVTGIPLLWAKSKTSAHIFGVYAVICFCVTVMCYISQPFARQSITPADGLGMAEALKDPWMTVHPPLVFIAYSAMAALAAYSVSLPSVDKIHFWMRLSWIALGLGIFTGSIWAYRALGWGGYWNWDPIENAALVPWLILCGYLHKNSTISRARCILPFAAACFGTFLTRSGILKDSSSHAYAGGNLLTSIINISLLLGAVCWLVITKAIQLKKGHKKYSIKYIKEISGDKRRIFACIIYAYAFMIFVGTIAPLVSNINTPAEYYNAVSIIFALVYTALLLIWDWAALKRRNLQMMALSTVAVIAAAFALGSDKLFWLLILWACFMPLSLWIVSGFKTQSWRYYIPHIGMTLLILGIILSSGFGSSEYALIQQGGTSTVIGGTNIALPDMLGKDVITVSSFTGDYIVQCSGIISMPDGSRALPVIIKPMIIVFWVGGFVTILSPCITAALQKIISVKKRKQKPDC